MTKNITREMVIKRLLKKTKLSNPGEPNSCWVWTGAIGDNGYGTASLSLTPSSRPGKHISENWAVHRISWLLYNGPIPEGLLVCHDCDNRRCWNPGHLFLGTHKDNLQDASKKGRLFHQQNHQLDRYRLIQMGILEE